MKAIYYLKLLKNEFHSTIFATVDENGRPVTCTIDIMHADKEGLYFLTAKGKAFYGRLKRRPYVSLTGMKGEDTLSSKSITICGTVREIGSGRLTELFHENPYMEKIYPDESGKSALTVFQLYEGHGEFFDLSHHPIFREAFSFGGARAHDSGFFILDHCTGCGLCSNVCPQDCMDCSVLPAQIQREHCLHCGACMEICPESAIERRGL